MLSAATDMRNAIRTPVFKMLTPCPIYNYGKPNEMYPGYAYHGCPTMEPVWHGGRDRAVIDWFFRTYARPRGALGLSYMQTGQENGFEWERIAQGLPYQMEKIARAQKQDGLIVETLAETGKRFMREHAGNCPQTQVALDDWTGAGRQSVWYNSASYRANLFLDKGRLTFRDVHVMRDDYAEPYLGKPCKAWNANYFTPPVFDAFLAISNACFRPFAFDGRYTALKVEGDGRSVLTVVATREDGLESRFVFSENGIAADGVDCDWSWFEGERKSYAFDGYSYSIGCFARPERKSFFIGLGGEARPVGLKVNHLVSPGHVDGTPTFSWRMASDRPSARQTACRLKVEGIWDSGVVEDGTSVGVAYAGKPLESSRRYRWTVAVRDETGAWSESESATFSTGILNDGDWGDARWIAPDTPAPHDYRTALFRRGFASGKPVAEAWLTVAGAGVFVATVNGRPMTDDFLLPGATHAQRTRQACTYEVTRLLDRQVGSSNVVDVTVSTGWSRDRIAARNVVGRTLDPARPGTVRACLPFAHRRNDVFHST